jgi:hypothetical protein
MDKIIMCAESGINKFVFIFFGLFGISTLPLLIFLPEIRQNLLMLFFLVFTVFISILMVVFTYLVDIIIFENGFKVKYLKNSEMILFDDVKNTRSLSSAGVVGGTVFLTKKNTSFFAPFPLFSNGNEMLDYILKRIKESSASQSTSI